MNNLPLEIEHKFLIRIPDTEILRQQPKYKSEELLQIYLTLPADEQNPNGQRCRIRRHEGPDGVRYVKTIKQNVTHLTRIEVESEITAEEFRELMRYSSEGRSPIEKTRHSFVLDGFTYEVDIFPFWDDRGFLEVEVDSEEVVPPIPQFIKVIKNVTHDPRYRNSALSKEIITEDLQ